MSQNHRDGVKSRKKECGYEQVSRCKDCWFTGTEIENKTRAEKQHKTPINNGIKQSSSHSFVDDDSMEPDELSNKRRRVSTHKIPYIPLTGINTTKAVTNKNNSIGNGKNRCNIVFKTTQLLLDISSFLQFDTLIGIRRVNSLFRKELYFKFEMVDANKIYFIYNNYYIKSIVENTVSSLSDIAAWWLQLQSSKQEKKYALFRIFEKEKVKDTNYINKKKSVDTEKNRIYLCSFRFNDLKDTHITDLEWNKEVKQDELKFVTKLNTLNASGECPFGDPFNQLSNQLQRLKSMKNITSNDANYLILGSYYHIKPLICELKRCLSDKIRFKHCIENARNRCKVWLAYANSLSYMYLECFGMYMFNSDYILGSNICPQDLTTKTTYSTIGKWSFFAQLSVTGNFEYFQSFMDNLFNIINENNDNNEDSTQSTPKSLDILMNGITSMFSVYLRLDLLKSSKYNCDHCSNTFQGLPFNTFFCAANPSILRQLRQGLENKFKFSFSNSAENHNCDGEHFHPNSRLYYMYNLCFSSKLIVGWKKFHSLLGAGMYLGSRDSHYSIHVYRMIEQYKRFDKFAEIWQLDSFDDLKNDLEQQNVIHDKYRLILQYFFGLADKFVVFDQANDKYKLLDGIIDTNEKKKNDDIDYNYVDMMPTNEDDISNMYNVLINQPNMSEEAILNGLQNPSINRQDTRQFLFPQVSNLYQFNKRKDTSTYLILK